MSLCQFSVPRDERCFEDYAPGRTYECGSVSFSAEGIIAFARAYDPQDMHVDPEKAARSPLGGIIASGWHTVSEVMRLYVDHFLPGPANTPSPGVDHLRWRKPVRPGDTLRLRVTVCEAIPSRTRPDRGIVKTLLEAFNQRDELVLSLRANDILLRRPSQAKP